MEKAGKNWKGIHIIQILYHNNIRMDHKKIGEALLLLGHSEINQIGMLMSADYRDIVVTWTQ